MKKKNLLAALSAAALLVGCSSSSASTTTTTDTTSEESASVLRVGMECNYAPFNWSTDSSESDSAQPLSSGGYCDGYDVEMAEKLADALGLDVEIHKLDWDNLILNLTNNEIDVIIAGMTATEERLEVINFTDPYYESEEVIIVRADGEYASATSIQDFSGATIQGQMNTIYDEVIDQIEGVNHEQAATDFPAAINALNVGAIDGVVSELPVANGVVAANPSLSIVRFAEGEGFEADTTVSIGVRKEDTELLDSLNAALAEITEDDRNEMMEDAVNRQPSNE